MAEATVSPAGMRIVSLLVGNPPQAVATLIKATGVTRTAVTEQLNELVAAGFVERTTERLTGRGRPRHLYAATHAALLLLFASNQRLVVPALWKAIEVVGGKDLTERVLKRAGRILADHYKRRISGHTPQERLRQMTQLLREEGGLIEITQNEKGHLVMRKRSCAFISMFEETRAVCGLDQEMMSDIVGASVRRVTCRHDGDPCCSFELFSTNGR